MTADDFGVRKVVDKTKAGSLFSTVKELLSEEVRSESGVPHETSDTSSVDIAFTTNESPAG
jgi:hypothetical protein